MNLLCVQIMKCAMTVRWFMGIKKRLRVNLSRLFYWWPRLESNQSYQFGMEKREVKPKPA